LNAKAKHNRETERRLTSAVEKAFGADRGHQKDWTVQTVHQDISRGGRTVVGGDEGGDGMMGTQSLTGDFDNDSALRMGRRSS